MRKKEILLENLIFSEEIKEEIENFMITQTYEILPIFIPPYPEELN